MEPKVILSSGLWWDSQACQSRPVLLFIFLFHEVILFLLREGMKLSSTCSLTFDWLFNIYICTWQKAYKSKFTGKRVNHINNDPCDFYCCQISLQMWLLCTLQTRITTPCFTQPSWNLTSDEHRGGPSGPILTLLGFIFPDTSAWTKVYLCWPDFYRGLSVLPGKVRQTLTMQLHWDHWTTIS